MSIPCSQPRRRTRDALRRPRVSCPHEQRCPNDLVHMHRLNGDGFHGESASTGHAVRRNVCERRLMLQAGHATKVHGSSHEQLRAGKRQTQGLRLNMHTNLGAERGGRFPVLLGNGSGHVHVRSLRLVNRPHDQIRSCHQVQRQVDGRLAGPLNMLRQCVEMGMVDVPVKKIAFPA